MTDPNLAALPPPLRVLPDMPSAWVDVEEDFDTAAEKIIQVHEQDVDHRDLPILDLRTWGVVPAEGRFAIGPIGGHHPPRHLRSNGFSNLMGKLAAPAEFVRDKLPAPLQLAVINYLLASPDKAIPGTLRLRGDEVTAVVSERYAPLDAAELMDAVRHALVQHGALNKVQVRSVATGLTDVMRLTFPSEQQEIKVGDVTALGLDISSSSFGRSAVHMRGVLFRLLCKNGLVAMERQSVFSFRHVGESQRLRDGITEAIPTVLAHTRGTMDRWRQAVTVMIDRVEDLINGMRELNAGERDRVQQELKTEAGIPELPESTDLFALTNSITGAARQAEPARRLEMESFAGQLLSRHVGRA